MNRSNLLRFLILAGLVAVAYIPTFDWMIGRWSATDTYYSHGFLVPFVSIGIVWLMRKELFALPVKPSPWGWPILIIGILIFLLSALWRVYFSSGFSLILVITGLVLIFLGARHLKTLWFPITFLLFMVPLPMVVVANVSFRLKIFASQVSTVAVNMLGVPAIREGSVIKTLHSYVLVEDPCSGIRSLIALIALGALMAYFSKMSARRKFVLFLMSIPLAVVTNIIRIVTVTLASEVYGSKFATGAFHDAMGIMVFVLAFVGMLVIANLLE
jgi:exosortase